MATDKSEPRVGLIFKVGGLSIVTLIVVHSALVSYFDRIARAEEHRKLGEAQPEALLSLRADEKARLASGSMPIEKAMQEVAAKGRKALPDVAPAASRDLTPLQGWQKMPAEVPPEMTAPAPPPPGLAAPPGDGGAASLATDAGAGKKDRARGEAGAGRTTKTPPKQP